MGKLKEKLRQQRKKEEEYMGERRRREEELLSLESSYKSLNEEVEAMRGKFARIKTKYVETLSEMRDIQGEH